MLLAFRGRITLPRKLAFWSSASTSGLEKSKEEHVHFREVSKLAKTCRRRHWLLRNMESPVMSINIKSRHYVASGYLLIDVLQSWLSISLGNEELEIARTHSLRQANFEGKLLSSMLILFSTNLLPFGTVLACVAVRASPLWPSARVRPARLDFFLSALRGTEACLLTFRSSGTCRGKPDKWDCCFTNGLLLWRRVPTFSKPGRATTCRPLEAL